MVLLLLDSKYDFYFFLIRPQEFPKRNKKYLVKVNLQISSKSIQLNLIHGTIQLELFYL